MSNGTVFSLRVLLGVCCVALVTAGMGCQLIADPFADEQASLPPVTTSSVDGIAAAGRTASPRVRRSYEKTYAGAVAAPVTYGPLYFADPFEAAADDDGQYAWTGKDYLLILHGPTQFLLNGVSWPAAAVVAPPWRVMSSDSQARWLRAGCIPFLRIDEPGSFGR